MIENINIEPFENELPSEYADRLGMYYSKLVTTKHKKDRGQFFTPPPIAHLMASYCDITIESVRILDPGCGTAILTCALIESLLQKNKDLNQIDLVAYETDLNLISFSQKTLNYIKKWLNEKGIRFQFVLHIHDFILDNSEVLKVDNLPVNNFDIIISNPPYFKLAKDDIKAIAAKELVSGQPNIYSIFMGIASKMLKENGELIFITPRSFASGNYFKAFRRHFFMTVQLDKIHLFNSRKDTFNRDSVLQETVIIKAVKETINSNKRVLISSSLGIKDIMTIRYLYQVVSKAAINSLSDSLSPKYLLLNL